MSVALPERPVQFEPHVPEVKSGVGVPPPQKPPKAPPVSPPEDD